MRRRGVLGGAVPATVGILLGLPSPVTSQAQPSQTAIPEPDPRAAFLAEAATAAERYGDRSRAIADGFRSLGPDFPGMGVHWVQIGRIVSGELDASRPAVLCYVEIDGRPRLVGLAYALPLAAEETPPAVPFGREAWHDHSGQVDEESLLLNHPSTVHASPDGFRLSMVHVWQPLENPEGPLAQNNWRLPFLRAGLPAPSHPPPHAARGLSLASSGAHYYRELFQWAADGDAEAGANLDSVIRRWSRRVDDWLASRSEGPVTEEELARLATYWDGLWADMEGSLHPAVFERLLPLRDGHG